MECRIFPFFFFFFFCKWFFYNCLLNTSRETKQFTTSHQIMRAPYNNTELATELVILLKHKNLKRVFEFFFFKKKIRSSITAYFHYYGARSFWLRGTFLTHIALFRQQLSAPARNTVAVRITFALRSLMNY